MRTVGRRVQLLAIASEKRAPRSGADVVLGRPAPRVDDGWRSQLSRSECPPAVGSTSRLPMTNPTIQPSSTIALVGRPESSHVTDGSDFLPYPKQGPIDHNEDVSVGLGRRLRTMAGAAQKRGQAGFGSKHSPQSEGERGVKSAPRSRLYWVGRKGFEGFMQVTRWSEGVPRRRGRKESGVYWIEALTATDYRPRWSRSRSRHFLATPIAS